MGTNLLQKPPESWRYAIQKLMAAWDAGRFPQAVLLDGPAGIGKKQLAMDLMAFLTCEDKANRPCGRCFACKLAYDTGAVDQWLVPLQLDAEERKRPEKANEATAECLKKLHSNPYDLGIFTASAYIAVPQVRALWTRINYKVDGVRVYIIAEADAMNDNAANALLKTLEEVPPQTYFILTTANRHKLLQTIQSRSLPLRLPALTSAEIAQVLKDRGLGVPADDLLGMSMGSVGKAMQCLEMDLSLTQQRAIEFLQSVASKQWSKLFRAMDSWFAKDMDAALFFLEVLSILLADMLRATSGTKLRFPSLAGACGDLFTTESTDRFLALISLAVHRIEERKGSIPVILQTLALQFGEA